MRRQRSSRIVATLGPASANRETIRALAEAGANVFGLNFSHATHDDHAERYRDIREVEKQVGRPIGILLDLRGPKLRVGRRSRPRGITERKRSFKSASRHSPNRTPLDST